jgi:hypothetical protein
VPRLFRLTEAIRPGVIGSFVLHVLAVFLVGYGILAPQVLQTALQIVPVDLVLPSEETVSPPQQQKAVVPQQRAALPQPKGAAPQQNAPRISRPETSQSNALASLVPPKNDAPADELQIRLEALSRLRQPETTDSRLLDRSGVSDRTATSNGAILGPQATYSVRDLVRAQVERRWNLALDELGDRNFVIAIHVVLTRDGTVTKAEIVDTARYSADATYRSIALSARNAVLLSSPLALPSGDYDETMDITLNLNPRNSLR